MAFDVITPSVMGRGAIATSPATTTLFTVATLERGILKTIDISNTTSASRRMTLYLVPKGDPPSGENILIPNVRVPGNGMFQWSGAQVLNEGDNIVGTADGAGLTYHGSGGAAR